MFIKRNDQQIIEALETFATCDISDGLLNLYKIPNGGFIPNLELRASAKDRKKSIVGRAYTVKYVSTEDPEFTDKPTVNYIDKIPEESILVSGLAEELQLTTAPYVKPITAIFGGLNAQRAQYLKCRGAVVLARVRDVGELQELGFPMYSYGVSTCSSNTNLKPVSVDETLHILTSDGLKICINSGDLIILDDNGVVRIPCTFQIDFDQLIEYIHKSTKVDELIAQDIGVGKCIKSSRAERRYILKEITN
ncbi:4-hydroxy-4-methyl-2-oxoglutarate aldolase [Monosporozyma unispora]|nr:hypothetical protein C6P44_000913 [Kazachstania unispora]